ncbi:MAG: polysaccharide pyruvyl transferase family protein [Spirosomataceae bacterium]
MLESDENVNLDKPQKTKVGIITILGVNNYGADLQAFALYKKLDDLGFDSEIINYPFYKNSRYISEKKAKSKFSSSRITLVKDFILGVLDKLSKILNPSVAKVRSERFEEFKSKNMKFSKEYRSFSSLYSSTHEYNVAIVGSDQVWNPNNPINLEPYFLTFIPKGVKKISYASSFGVSEIDIENYPSYYKMLNNLDEISTREESGVKLIKAIADRTAEHVLDPTLLLEREEWLNFSKEIDLDEPYILLFVFKNSKFITSLALELQRITGYKVVRICKNEMRVESDKKIINLRELGPSEFLGVYQKATFVLTSSFHGTVFAMIFEKPFYTVSLSSKNNNTRQESLLKLVGLEDRILYEGDSSVSPEFSSIDYTNVNTILSVQREKSISFLKRVVKK